jgi:hypothetical protein
MLSTRLSNWMIRGTLIAESIRPGSSLKGIPLTLTEISRDFATNASPDQPQIWTGIEFESTGDPTHLSDALAAVLDDKPFVWYCNFTAEDEVSIVYPKKVFRYRRGDAQRRREAQDYGRTQGVPTSQLDWTE